MPPPPGDRRPPIVFRAIWPIVNENQSYADLCREAGADLPLLIAQAKAHLLAPGRFSVAPASTIPGSGGVTESVLIYEAPARRMANRPYWKGAA